MQLWPLASSFVACDLLGLQGSQCWEITIILQSYHAADGDELHRALKHFVT